jgi:CDP-glucose 4,6-dehydratase
VGWIAEKMTGFWGNGATWVLDPDPGVHEAGYLKLDASRAHAELGWSPKLDLETALKWLVDWYRAWQDGANMRDITVDQIKAYEALLAK